jgi:hypothetical protein
MLNNQERATEEISTEITQQENDGISSVAQDNPDNAKVNQSSQKNEDLKLQIYKPKVANIEAELPNKKIPKEFIYFRNFIPAIIFAAGTLYSFINELTLPGIACLVPATITFCVGAIYSRKYSELQETNKLLSRNTSNSQSTQKERDNVVENIRETAKLDKDNDSARIESIIRPDPAEPNESSREAVTPATNTSPKKANQQRTDLSSRSSQNIP